MKLRQSLGGLLWITVLSHTGCRNPPGRPLPGSEAKRPSQVLDFPTLYAKNCAGCHGDKGRGGAAISLANPVYLGVAGLSNIERATAQGVTGTLMPAFARSAGGLLTDDQIRILSQGMIDAWGKASLNLAGAPAYAASAPGDASQGQQAFTARCATCHGAGGEGKAAAGQAIGSLVDPAYLALISDQGLRSLVIAGMPEHGMPDWHSYPAGPLTDADVTNIVAWLASRRSPTPGKPYRQHP